MPYLTSRWRIARRAALHFAKTTSGLAAVEFAMIAAPFFLMLFAVLEVAMVFFVGAVLENATTEAARDIRTGRFQAAGGGQGEFRNAVCERASMLIDCSRIQLDVRTFEDFDEIDAANPTGDDGELDTDNFGFDPGNEREVVLVRVFYEWKVVTPMLGAGFSNMPGNKRLMTGAAAFRNEPFGG